MKQLSPLQGFMLSVGHGNRKRRMQKALVPYGAELPMDLDLVDVMVDLDPGMINWDSGRIIDVA